VYFTTCIGLKMTKLSETRCKGYQISEKIKGSVATDGLLHYALGRNLLPPWLSIKILTVFLEIPKRFRAPLTTSSWTPAQGRPSPKPVLVTIPIYLIRYKFWLMFSGFAFTVSPATQQQQQQEHKSLRQRTQPQWLQSIETLLGKWYSVTQINKKLLPWMETEGYKKESYWNLF
jgi:hypothetical protein